jgi:hypothetical protein
LAARLGERYAEGNLPGEDQILLEGGPLQSDEGSNPEQGGLNKRLTQAVLRRYADDSGKQYLDLAYCICVDRERPTHNYQ